jgi:hypothetical protein
MAHGMQTEIARTGLAGGIVQDFHIPSIKHRIAIGLGALR